MFIEHVYVPDYPPKRGYATTARRLPAAPPIELCVFMGVLGFALVVLMSGAELVAAGTFVAAVVTAATTAAVRIARRSS
jgi:hypothetical protein